MKKMGNLVRRILYKLLPFESYLFLLSKLYFFAFNTGILKFSNLANYPYFLKNLITKGSVCIDIGANMGYISAILAKLAGKSGKVYAVEPVKPILSVLKKNTKKFKNIEILPYALGVENTCIKLGNNSVKDKGFVATGSHFVLDKESEAEVEFEAEMRKGSELFKDLEKLEFIKCDIEGFEIVVLPEMKTIIEKFQPLLLVETGGENRRIMLEFFDNLNYKAFILNNNRLTGASLNESLDIFFIPIDKIDKITKYID